MNLVQNLLAFLILYTSTIDGFRILGVFPFAARSHNIFFEALMKGLAKRGHQVDVISHYKIGNPPENYKTILDLSEFRSQHVVDLSIEKAFDFKNNALSQIAKLYGNDLCELMKLEEMQHIFKNSSRERFYDLVISEFFGATCYFGLGHLLEVPVVGAISFPETAWAAKSIGNPASAAFSPSTMMDIAEMKTFSDRLKNTFLKFLSMTIFSFTTEEAQTVAMRKYLSPQMPSIREIEKNVDLLLTNNYHSLYGVRPTTPALIEVGGLHISQDEAQFTPELKKWMDESEDGVVYFTFGTAILLETLPRETMLSFYSSFAKISPVRILMKVKDKSQLPSGLPENVKTSSWIPQIPVLGHNNTRAFITHCGLLGLQESLHFGVPIIGIPLHSDQFRNVQIFVKKHMGIRINYEDITDQNLDDALNRILNDSSYREAAKYESRIFLDRPLTPMDTAIFWIEYIARNGRNILKSPAVDLHWIQNQLLDVYAFLLISLMLTIYLIKIMSRTIFRPNKLGFRLYASFNIRYRRPIANGKMKDSQNM